VRIPARNIGFHSQTSVIAERFSKIQKCKNLPGRSHGGRRAPLKKKKKHTARSNNFWVFAFSKNVRANTNPRTPQESQTPQTRQAFLEKLANSKT
jgi:hypothetical protein